MTNKSESIEKKKVITPKFRVSFPAIDKPKAFEQQEPKYSLVMLFDKTTDLVAMKLAANNAAAEKWGPDKKKWPKMRNPFRDGDEDRGDVQGYQNTIFVSASSKNQPGVVDQGLQPMLNIANDLYAGCYARAELIAFAYDKAGNKGVGFSLQNIQKLGDGDKFSGRRDASTVFDKVEDGSNDAASYDGGDAEQSQDGMGF